MVAPVLLEREAKGDKANRAQEQVVQCQREYSTRMQAWA
jgi:hypothetical protein